MIADHRTTRRDQTHIEDVDQAGSRSDVESRSELGGPKKRLIVALRSVSNLAAFKAVQRRTEPVWRAVTPLGRSVLVGVVISAALAKVFGWAEFAILSVAGALSLVVGVVLLVLANNKLEVSLGLRVRRVVAGDYASTDVETVNTAGRRMLPVRLEARIGRGQAVIEVPSLSTGQSHVEQIVIGTDKRAVVPVGPVRSVQGDPLGLVRREVMWTGTEDLFVHPRTTRIGPLINGLRRDLEGEATNHRSPSDVAFHALREYVMGDDRRHVHWRTTARQADGSLMVREFVDTRRSEVAVVVTMRHEDWSDDDSFELGVSAAASIALRANADGLDFLFLTGHRQVPVHRVTGMMDSLSRIDRGDDDYLMSTIIRRHKDRLAATSIAVLVAGSTADLADIRRAVTLIGNQTLVVVVIADTSRNSGRRAASGLTICDIGALDDLGRTLAVIGL